MDIRRLEGTVLDPAYKLGRLLGAGGMGAVYEATGRDGEAVAVKVIDPRPARRMPTALPRFVLEARVASRIDSPHVVAAREIGVDHRLGVTYLVMELLRGQSVEALVEQLAPVEPLVGAAIGAQAARGLAAAHAGGVIHRDVKPANIFLQERAGGELLVRVCDFGVAKLCGEQGPALTASGSLLGTPLYMSPEQARSSRRVDERTDVFSLGMTLFELLSGRLPFEQATTTPELLLSLCHERVPSLSLFAPWVPGALVEAIDGALERDPARRTASMAEVAERLERAASGVRIERAALSRARASSGVAHCLQTETIDGPASARWQGSVVGGRYLVGGRRARGVLDATDDEGRSVSLVLLGVGVGDDVDDDEAEAVLAALRSLEGLRGRRLAAVIEAGIDEQTGVGFVATERVEGELLRSMVARAGPLDEGRAVNIVVQACEAVEALSRAGVVHAGLGDESLVVGPGDEVTLIDIGAWLLPRGVDAPRAGRDAVALSLLLCRLLSREPVAEAAEASMALSRAGRAAGDRVRVAIERGLVAKDAGAVTALREALSARDETRRGRGWALVAVGLAVVAVASWWGLR